MRKQRTMKWLFKGMTGIARTMSDLLSTSIEQGTAATTLGAAYRQCSEMSQSAMSSAEFADMACELFVYSCFVARYYQGESEVFQRQHISGILTYAHPLHRQCVEAIISIETGGMTTCIDEMLCLLAAVDKESIDRSFQDDALTHFYELFLHDYNPRLRAEHGIFYTPEPIVCYIVRSIDQLLRSRFGYRAGLGEIDKDMRILDPACGTGVFVQATLEHIRATYQRDGQAEMWREHLHRRFLPRLAGIEVLLTPYLIAHLRLNLFLAGVDVGETGQVVSETERAEQETGRSEEPGQVVSETERAEREPGRGQAPPLQYTNQHMVDAYGKEGTCPSIDNLPTVFRLGNALSEIGVQQDSQAPIMIVLGNPPYAGHSTNREAWMLSLLDEYKEGCPELQKRAQAKWLSDDYVKFTRLAQWQIERAGQGILAFVTSHSYLDNPTFRGMRFSLTRSFDELFVLDLHGNSKKQECSPGDTKDENVFTIQPGVSISIFVKRKEFSKHTLTIYYAELWGSRADKLSWLAAHDLESTSWTIQHPQAPYYLFAPQETQHLAEYEAGWSIPDIFRPNGDPAPGIITCHDEFAISWSCDQAIDKVERLLATRDEDEARQLYRLCAQEQWDYAAAKRALSAGTWRQQLTPVLYRPFDSRWTVYNRHVAVHLRERVTRHMLSSAVQGGRGNLALLIGKAGQVISQQTWDIVFCSRSMTEFNLFRRGGNNIFPLYLASNDSDDGQASRDVNIAPAFIAEVVSRLGLQWIAEGQGDLQQTVGPEDIFSYVYALLHAPAYRARYAAFLKRDFPRIPLPSNLVLFRVLCCTGRELVRLHLMEVEARSDAPGYCARGNHRVEQVRYVPHEDDETMGRVWINATQYFEQVPLAAWKMHIGGYQICLKWLKDRKGHVLNREEIAHYQKIVTILTETIRLMAKIDNVIEQEGLVPLPITRVY